MLADPANELVPFLGDYVAFTLNLGKQYGLHPQTTSTFRSLAKQRDLRDAYLASLQDGTYGTPGGVEYPANAPGDSSHNWSVGWDSWVPEGEWDLWNEIRAYVGWGLSANDRVHAELPNWRSYRDQLTALGYAPR